MGTEAPAPSTTTTKCEPVTAMDGCNAKCPKGKIICRRGKLKSTDFHFSSKKLSDSKYLTNWKVPAGEVGDRCKMYCPGENSFSIRCRRNTSDQMMPDLIKISQKYFMSGFFDKNIPCQDF